MRDRNIPLLAFNIILMKYEIIKWRINWHLKGETIELDEKLGNSYGNKYLKPLKEEKKGNKENNENKEQKDIQNKALTSENTDTKWPEKNW